MATSFMTQCDEFSVLHHELTKQVNNFQLYLDKALNGLQPGLNNLKGHRLLATSAYILQTKTMTLYW